MNKRQRKKFEKRVSVGGIAQALYKRFVYEMEWDLLYFGTHLRDEKGNRLDPQHVYFEQPLRTVETNFKKEVKE